jgi:hypothetical protein
MLNPWLSIVLTSVNLVSTFEHTSLVLVLVFSISLNSHNNLVLGPYIGSFLELPYQSSFGIGCKIDFLASTRQVCTSY